MGGVLGPRRVEDVAEQEAEQKAPADARKDARGRALAVSPAGVAVVPRLER